MQKGRGGAGEGQGRDKVGRHEHKAKAHQCSEARTMLLADGGTAGTLTNFSECPFGSTYSWLLSANPLDTDTLLDLITDCSVECKEEQSVVHRPHGVLPLCHQHTNMKPTHKGVVQHFIMAPLWPSHYKSTAPNLHTYFIGRYTPK